jgi:phospholipid/cholesterol/gamma-HCH transport system substrate-binding protein
MKKYSMETTVGLFVVIGLLCVGYMAVKLGKVSLLGSDYYSLSAKFTSVSGLRVNSAIEMFGIEIGRVERLDVNQDEQTAVAVMKIRKDTKIFDDAIASIRTSGLIGDRYISITPGGSGEALKPGGLIRDTESPTDLTDLIGKYAFGEVGKSKDK